ncbi:heparin lyase I family protein [Agarivorans gilvus]|uniref:Polysaccharide lyase n=1 Tax=Agarivorans gilvus TaxID=680279 RepID=A0ABQ1I3A2_9ALTE|nr:heparin lyase I family protein [Agarivorans gilvus]GGB12390.1 hypothetical protein GCM10007414_27220 [Agarivorans gilvus]
MKIYTLVSLFLLTLCIKTNAAAPPPLAKDPQVKQQVLSTIDALQHSQYFSIEAAPNESLFIHDNYVSMTLEEDTAEIYNGIRSELVFNNPYLEEDELEYRFQIRFEEGFDQNLSFYWWLFAQWHDQPDRNLGETWINFPSNSPPVSLALKSKSDLLGIALLINGNFYYWQEIETYRWYDIAFNIKWSTEETGEVTYCIDGNCHPKIIERNMLNHYQHYFKIGQYRNRNTTSKNTISIKEIKITNINITN